MSTPRSRLYAYGTKVSVQSSQFEIQRILSRFKASGFAFMQEPGSRKAMVLFQVKDRRIRFDVPEPTNARSRAPADLDLETMRLWRSLAMAIKSKLDIIESGIATFEEEFLPYTLVNGNETFYQASQNPEFAPMLSGPSMAIALSGGKG